MSQEIVENYWKRVRRFLPVLRLVPNLRMVAVCNNLAFSKVDETSDIDLFVIAKKGRLFSTRLIVTLLLQVMGVRRHGDAVAGRFCLSFFVDDSALNLKSIALKNDIYLSYWIKSMLPVIDDGVSRKFLKSNSWAKDRFEFRDDFCIDGSRVFKKSILMNFLREFYKLTFDLILGSFVELVLRGWQLKRARRKAEFAAAGSSLVITSHILKFHNIDRRRHYRDLWEKKYGIKAKLSTERFSAL